MGTGAITQYFDAAQVTLYAFWIFFFGLIYYLRKEDKREGYPMITGDADGTAIGFPPLPAPKTFLLRDGTSVQAPREGRPEVDYKATAPGFLTGAPSDPVGNPLLSASGPAGYALRADKPELTWHNDETRLAPMRVATDHSFDEYSPNPIGFEVLGCDGIAGGSVKDVWVDREESVIRYYEVTVPGGKSVFVPVALVRVNESANQVLLASVTGKQIGEAPTIASPDQITWREEDQTQAYFASGQLFATPSRRESLI
nr:photosynthetic reaction center subunit H [uncultured Rhodopila sp.]